MITRTARPDQHESQWQSDYANAFTDAHTLLNWLDLEPEQLESPIIRVQHFPLRVPRHYAGLMRKGDPADPLLRQVLSIADEEQLANGFHSDPVGDAVAEVVPGLLHKYHGRVLMICTGACAIHCRYCFRRHYPYSESHLTRQNLHAMLDYIRADTSITEVILSGGDPLSLTDHKLGDLITTLEQIPHLQTLRIHSRLPVVIPSRITDELVELFAGTRLNVLMVIHANHPNEIDVGLAESLLLLTANGVRLYNQSVLLCGVNDHADTLVELSQRLFRAGVQPYYLHLLDRVQGAAHFFVDAETAIGLHTAMRDKLPGYLLPALVTEIAGETSKLPVLGQASKKD